jgi:hypothetical protein
MKVIGQLQPFIVGQQLVVRAPSSERNAQMVSPDGVTLGDPVSLPSGTQVVVVELRPLQFTDVVAASQRFRMLANSYLAIAAT